MFCANCGEKVSSEDAFCKNCGSPIKHQEETPKVEETKQEQDVLAEQVSLEPKVESSSVQGFSSTNRVLEREKVKKGSSGKGLLIILFIIVLLAIIGSGLYFFVFKNTFKSAYDVLEAAFNKMENLDSYTIAINGNIATKGEDAVNITLNLETSVDVKNKKSKITSKVSTSGVEVEVPAYVDGSDIDNSVVYFKLPAMLSDSNKWSKISISESDLSGVVSMPEQTEVDEEFNITDDEIEQLELKDDLIIGIYVTKKDNYISKVKFDLGDYVNKLASGEVEFEKLVITIEIKDINKVSEIIIPEATKDALELDLSDIMNDYFFGNNDDDYYYDDDYDDDYVDDYTITDMGFKVKYDMPNGFEASSVNDAYFKIYRNDDLRVVLSIYGDTADDRFSEIESDKEYYEQTANYKNVELSDEKTIKVNGKEFVYKELSYETSYGTEYYEATVCYELDKDHVYRLEYEKQDSPITESELKLFLDIEVTKIQN